MNPPIFRYMYRITLKNKYLSASYQEYFIVFVLKCVLNDII